jgi:serine/threonine protein kinase
MQAEARQLLPGTLLHRGRYSLQKSLHKQEWPLGIVETTWAAFDTRIEKSLVIIRELNMPDGVPVEANFIPYTATKVFTSIGRNGHILPLRDVFSDQGSHFFVFEPVDGLPLMTLMFNNGRKLPAKEVVTCCLQIVELLDICWQQSPPLVHGNIRPEYIVKKSSDSQYVLTNFSVALAGGLARVVAGMEEKGSSPQTSHVLMKGLMDRRADLYMLLEVALYAITGQWLSGVGDTLIPAMVTASDISPNLRAILLKGLRVSLEQRYQTPAELYQDLQVLQSGYERELSPLHFAMSELGTLPSVPVVQVVKPESMDPLITDLPVGGLLEQTLLVPLPEELPPLKEANDMRNAALWFVGMMFCLMLLLGHGLL